jgi:ABC-type transport system involved in multi-copper enzyme maturation permease subunit
MSQAIAVRMIGADFLKVGKRRGTMIWALVLALAPLLIYFIVAAAQHSSNPQHSPAGGIGGYRDAIGVLAAVFGPLAAILIGTDCGAGDVTAGVFRDLVVTGRSRLALFGSRVPAALALTWLVVGIGYVLAIAGTFAFASGTPTPGASLLVNGLGYSLLSAGVVCVVAVGFASLTASRPAALTVLIGWQLVASPILANIDALGGSRKLVLSQAISHFSPLSLNDGRDSTVVMSGGVAVIVMAGWFAVFLALGAWRTSKMDA